MGRWHDLRKIRVPVIQFARITLVSNGEFEIYFYPDWLRQ
jgi:hypothetical protein